MGKDALPYIREAHSIEHINQKESIHTLAWYALIQTIVGEALILPEDIATPFDRFIGYNVLKLEIFV